MNKVKVSKIISSRYSDLNNKKPRVWDRRVSGVDTIEDSTGKTIKLLSDGGQSVPEPNWDIVLMSGDNTSGYRWTLFGMPKA